MTAVSKAAEFSGVSSVISVTYALKLSNMIYLNFSPALSACLRAVSSGIVCTTEHNCLNAFFNDLYKCFRVLCICQLECSQRMERL